MHEVVFHDHVLAVVNETVARHPPEQGGILLGPVGLPVVSQFLPDPDAAATGVTFRPSERVAALARAATGGDTEVKGLLHSHPSGMDRPSAGDEGSFVSWLRRMPWMPGLIAPIVTERRPRRGDDGHKIDLDDGEMSVFIAERRPNDRVKLLAPSVRVLPVAAAVASLSDRFGLHRETSEISYVAVAGHRMASTTLRDPEGGVWTLMLPYTYPLHPPVILRPATGRESSADLEAVALTWDLNLADTDRLDVALGLLPVADEVPAAPPAPAPDVIAEVFEGEVSDPIRDGLRARLDGSVASSVRDRTVLVVGLGSGGSQTVEALTRSSVERFVVIDPDEVEAVNLSRSAYDVGDLGCAKTEAIARRVQDINPGATVVAHQNRLDDLAPDELARIIEGVDLVVAATDDPEAQYRLDQLAWQHGCPAVFAGVYERGAAGEVIFTIPGATACFRCATGGVRGGRRGTARLNYGTGQLIAEPALGPDITHVVSAAVKVAIGLLELSDPSAAQNSAASMVAQAANDGMTFLQIAMVPDYDFFPRVFAGVPGQHAYQSIWLETMSNPECPVCGDQPRSETPTAPIDLTALVPVPDADTAADTDAIGPIDDHD